MIRAQLRITHIRPRAGREKEEQDCGQRKRLHDDDLKEGEFGISVTESIAKATDQE
jgi:hypothetical protein